MKRRQTTALLLGMALTVISLSGCAREKSTEQTGQAGTDVMQEQVWQDKPETADDGIPSYEDYLKINGDAEELPYENAQNVSFSRLYMDETYFGMSQNDFQKDVRGNELRPDLVEQFEWQTRLAHDPQREHVGPVYFYLTKGRHTLTLRLKQEAAAIDKITFLRASEPEDYESAMDRWEELGASDSSGYLEEYEAEAGWLKNDVTLCKAR